MAAGLAALNTLTPDLYAHLESHGARLETGLREAAASAGVPARIYRIGSIISMFFTDQPVTDYETAKKSNTTRFGKFFHAMLERGIYLPPSQYEALFVSAAHSDADIDRTVEAAKESFAIAFA